MKLCICCHGNHLCCKIVLIQGTNVQIWTRSVFKQENYKVFRSCHGKKFSQQLFLLCINVFDPRHMCNKYECEMFQTTK